MIKQSIKFYKFHYHVWKSTDIWKMSASFDLLSLRHSWRLSKSSKTFYINENLWVFLNWLTTLLLWRFCFSLRTSYKELIWYTNDPNAQIRTFCKRWNFVWRRFFSVSILKSIATRTSIFDAGGNADPSLITIFDKVIFHSA